MKIALNIIMKNESHVLLRMLNSVSPLIDYYVVIDTGSTDNSKLMVKHFFDAKGIPGEIHEHPFVNFEDARNFGIEKAKGKADFNFVMDCDEVLVLPKDFNLGKLKSELEKVDVGQIQMNYGLMVYTRRAFYRNSKPFYYLGAVHEVLMCKEPDIIFGSIPGISVIVHPDGASWKGGEKEKYLAHAKIIHDYIIKNGYEPRHVFYLAQSYRDALEHEKALGWYQKRVQITDGFFEERYYSQLMVADLKWRMAKPVAEVAGEFLQCSELDELRAEHFRMLMQMYQNNGHPKLAKIIQKLLKEYEGKNPFPARQLFLNPKAYEPIAVEPTVIKPGKVQSLNEIGLFHKTDKATEHKYCDLYDNVLSFKRNDKVELLEIGIWQGASLKMWRDYFPNGSITGLDIMNCEYLNQGRIKTLRGSASDREFLKSLKLSPDIIIDDGGHTMDQQAISLGVMFKKLKPGGIYILEDLHTSFHPDWGGNPENKGTVLAAIMNLKTNGKISNEFLTNEECRFIEQNTAHILLHGKMFGNLENTTGGITAVIYKKPEVDVCIISNAKTHELALVTVKAIETLMASEKYVKFNVFVIESNKGISYSLPVGSSRVIYPDVPFGYHRYLNLAIKAGSAPYVVLCNNDLTFEKDWASKIIRQMNLDSSIMSTSPFCPQVNQESLKTNPVHTGYEVRNHLAGWCIFQKREIYDIIGLLDEQFEFWYCDNDYSMTLQKHKIKHALITDSVVNHHGERLGKTGETVLNTEEKQKLTDGQQQKFTDKWFPKVKVKLPEMKSGTELLKYSLIGAIPKELNDKFLAGTLSEPEILSINSIELNEGQLNGDTWEIPPHGLTMIGKKRLDNIEFCIGNIMGENIKGDFVETGVWRGGACIFMADILWKYNISPRNIFVCDSFEGLPKPEEEKYPVDKGDKHHTHKFLAVDLETVKKSFQQYGVLNDNIKFIKGWFKDTMPVLPTQKISLLRLDGDMYSSTWEVLENLYSKVSSGGYIIIDDYALKGARKAVDDFRAQNNITDKIIPIDTMSVYWKKS